MQNYSGHKYEYEKLTHITNYLIKFLTLPEEKINKTSKTTTAIEAFKISNQQSQQKGDKFTIEHFSSH